MPKISQKKAVIALIALVLAIGVWFFFFKGDDEAAGKPSASVILYKVSKETLYDRVEVLGNAIANESVDITANTSENISEINFTDGQIVQKGDTIAVLEQREEQAQLKAAEAQLQEHQRELERLDNLLKNKAASKRDYDERITQVEIARQQIEEIKARISDRTITAPFDGVLGIRQVSVGALVQPGAVLTTIDDISTIKLDFNVPAIFLGQLTKGTPIEAEASILDGQTFKGVIDTISSRIDPVTRSMLVRAIIPNDEMYLKPGLLMQVTLLRNERQAIIIPEESTIQRQDKHFVFVVEPEKKIVTEREIIIGVHKPGIIEVTSGLTEGELVVVRGVQKVRVNQPVEVLEIWDKIKKPDSNTEVKEDIQ